LVYVQEKYEEDLKKEIKKLQVRESWDTVSSGFFLSAKTCTHIRWRVKVDEMEQRERLQKKKLKTSAEKYNSLGRGGGIGVY
jgi:hypothetical protein